MDENSNENMCRKVALLPCSLNVNAPKISVILPVYNGEEYLKEVIESVLAQTFRDFELIIIDDCSTDSSKEIALSYVDVDPRVSCFSNKTNLKLPKALNTGFSKAQGDYWTWTSCDNLYLPHALERMLEVLSNNSNVGLVYASMQEMDAQGKKQDVIYVGPAEHLIFRNVVGACFLYRRCVADHIGGYDPELFLCEDYEYWLRIAAVSKLHPMDACLYLYRRHGGSLSHNHEKEIIAKGIGVQKRYYSTFVKSRKEAALFYAHLRARDMYNPLRQFYVLMVLFYSPKQFFIELFGLIKRRFI